jgi:hypothetical protein
VADKKSNGREQATSKVIYFSLSTSPFSSLSQHAGGTSFQLPTETMENESTKASKKGENGLNKCKFTKIIIQSSNKGTKKTNRSNLSIPEPEQPIKRRTSKAVLGFAIEKVATWRLMRIPKIAFPISLSVHQECFVKFFFFFFLTGFCFVFVRKILVGLIAGLLLLGLITTVDLFWQEAFLASLISSPPLDTSQPQSQLEWRPRCCEL